MLEINKNLLKERGISIRELARLTDIDYDRLYRLMSGRNREVNLDVLDQVRLVLGVDVEELFTTGEPNVRKRSNKHRAGSA